ncbi:enoyl-CoA hydratase/isomerase family protein [Janibacter cremeus]|uniref:enoyl-CoA hydratase n=1 Tax=Janibacter cremeus TaxID=1285192 RepID=A0A852VJQ7_9MICO|nr:enoyl-CoA hydratase-related protein [Janibacter cremeus]NYF97302.1 enoyl-CoA hydratase/carnithine racemase [Janibacter cremeus]
MSDVVRLEVADGIGTIVLDRPKMNALDSTMQHRLVEVAEEADQRSDISAVILWGGEKVFAAGADVKEMAEMSYTDMSAHVRLLQRFSRAIAAIGKPTVAAITGFALGGGLELAMCCDFRIVASNAKLGQPEIALGIIPGAGGTQRLPRLVGPAKAKQMVFTGRPVSAQEALSIGLADQVVEPDEVLGAAQAMVAPFVGGPAQALKAAKESIDRGLEVDLQTGLEIEALQFTGLFATKDQKSGMRSFVENGPGKATFEGI